jgi:hypothetical protein
MSDDVDHTADISNTAALAAAFVALRAPATALDQALEAALEALARGVGKTDQERAWLAAGVEGLRNAREVIASLIRMADTGDTLAADVVAALASPPDNVPRH